MKKLKVFLSGVIFGVFGQACFAANSCSNNTYTYFNITNSTPYTGTMLEAPQIVPSNPPGVIFDSTASPPQTISSGQTVRIGVCNNETDSTIFPSVTLLYSFQKGSNTEYGVCSTITTLSTPFIAGKFKTGASCSGSPLKAIVSGNNIKITGQ